MMSVFKVTSEVTKAPVKVVARDSDEAAVIFGSWVEHRHPELGQVSFDTEIVSLFDMALQPQLQEVASRGVAGFLYWLGHRAGWVAAGPQEPQLGDLAPPKCEVKCYVFNDGDELFVFARALEHAIVIWNEWNLERYGERNDFHSVTELPRWLLQGPQVTLREDMDLGLAGVGTVCEDGFWRIYPPEYEVPLPS